MNTADYLQLLRQYKESASKKYGIKRIGIFGSVARGEQTENSDVDIVVSLTKPRLFTLVHIKEDLQQIFGRPVDIVRERDDMDLLLKNCILRDGIFALTRNSLSAKKDRNCCSTSHYPKRNGKDGE